jgi:pterin-4a-carbinolamine dehydratase
MKSSVKNLMENYFNQSIKKSHFGLSSDVPVKPYKNNWEIKSDPERLSRTFTFDARSRLKDFIDDIFTLEEQISHNGKITIDHDEVTIEVFTKDLNRVTSRDKDYSEFIDQVYENCLFYEY